MKFKNITTKVINMNVDSIWTAVEPGEFIELPHYVGHRQEGLVQDAEDPVDDEIVEDNDVVEDTIPLPEGFPLNQEQLEEKTKDELNDYAAKLGYDDIKSSMTKTSMVEKILEFQTTIGDEPEEEEQEEELNEDEN